MGNGGSKRRHQASMQQADHAHRERQAAAARAHEQRLAQERAAAQERTIRLQQQAQAAERQAALDRQKKADEQARYIKKLENEEKEKQRRHLEAEQLRQREHEQELEKLELQKKQKQKEIEAQEQRHKEDLKQMWINAKEKDRANKEKQRDDALVRVQGTINGLLTQIDRDNDELIKVNKECKSMEENLEIQDDNITNFNKDGKLKEERKEMESAHAEWKRSDDEIVAAINKTGQDENSVGRFLKLTHALIGQTTATQANANKLDAELHTFQTIIKRECQDKLTTETYFEEVNLDRFVPILGKGGYNECRKLICKDEEEFERDIFNYIEEAVDKEIDEWQKRHPNEQDPFESFLKHYRISKFKRALKESGLESLQDINEDLEDEDINQLIELANIKGLFVKRLKRAINDVKTGKYQPEDKREAKDNDDEKKNNDDDDKPSEVSGLEKRELRKICLEPDTWQPYEKEKADLTKSALLQMSPILAAFFDRMHIAVKQAQELLDMPKGNDDDMLNDKQIEAMNILMDNVKAIKAPDMEEKVEDEEEEEDNKAPDIDIDMDDPTQLADYEQRKAWKEASKVQVCSKTQNKWYNGKIIKITNDEEGEWLTIEYMTDKDKRTKQVDRFGGDIRDPIMMECRAIESAIKVDLDIVRLFRAEFEVSKTTKRALPIATGVEHSVRAILLCQSQIRESVRLAGAILNLKPANLNDISKPLWDAVDDGVIQILTSALEMYKISAQYFGFFLRFNSSFQRFISMNDENKDVTLFNSLEYIKQDIKEFSKFKIKFNKRVSELSDRATKVIANCVKRHIGAELFERARICREQSKEKYLEKKDIYDKKSLKLEDELETLCMKRANDRAICSKLQYQQKALEDTINRNQGYITEYREKESELNALNFDAGFQDKK